MYLTLLHNLLTIIILFPGSILMLINRVRPLRRYSETSKYLLCALFVVMLDLLFWHKHMYIYFAILIVAMLFFLLEYSIETRFDKSFTKIQTIYRKMKKPVMVIIIFPFLEEYIYRYFTYEIIVQYTNSILLYVVFSSIVFVSAHFYSQRLKALTKIPFAVVQALVFVFTLNIYVCLSIHIVFNVLILLYNNSKYFHSIR